MKKLRFHYEMQLTFDAAVAEHHFLFRFLPMKENGQECYGLRYGIEPSGKLHELTDGFGNRTCAGEAMEPHNSLEVWAEGTVFVDRSKTRKEDCHLLFSFPSAYTKADKALDTYLEERSQIWKGEKTEENSDMDFLFFLMNGLYQDFSYVPGKTNISTTASQAWAGRAGVCQDYAHIFLALCRLHGYAGRYVAGMMVGEGATHAWTEIYVNGSWIGFDPTNNCLADDNYIKLSHGRDFGDCTIDRGCIKGFASQQQNIYVKVED